MTHLPLHFIVRRSRMLLQSTVRTPVGSVSVSGYIRNSRGQPFSKMRVYGNYALVYLLDGSGRARFGKQPIVSCRAGDLLFLYPEIPHAYGPGPGETWNELYVTFYGSVFDLWRQNGILDPERPLLHLPRISRWRPQMEAIADPRLRDTPEGMLRRVCRLLQFLSDIMEGKLLINAHSVPWLDTAKRKLMEDTGISPAAVAAALGLSYERFRKDFSRYTGSSPTRYRALKLIEQARVLMAERNLSNKEIAETLGFYDEFHFSHRFKQVTGSSARQFRASLRSQGTS